LQQLRLPLPLLPVSLCQAIHTFNSDVGNFKLQFHLDSDVNEEFDTGADLFL